MDYLALLVFVITSCVTPGPNNIMVMTSGINHGLKKTILHVIGINVGFPFMVIMVGFGIDSVFQTYPLLFHFLKIVSALYLLYLAYGIFTSSVLTTLSPTKLRKPMGFFQAVIFQWVNPKAWIMAIGALSAFTTTGDNYLEQTLIVAWFYFLFGTPCTLIWLYLGSTLKQLLSEPFYFKVFNTTMAFLLVLSLAPIYHDIFLSLDNLF